MFSYFSIGQTMNLSKNKDKIVSINDLRLEYLMKTY